MRHWRPVHGWDGRVMMGGEIEARFGREPKPCPFCRSKTIGLYMGPSPHMTCGNCGADGPTFDGRKEDLEDRQRRAFDAWQAST